MDDDCTDDDSPRTKNNNMISLQSIYPDSCLNVLRFYLFVEVRGNIPAIPERQSLQSN